MAVHLKSREFGEEALAKDRPPIAEVQALLNTILESQPFRTSKQCKDLLRYVVEHSLRGDDAALRERIIGAEVFGRKPSYDTNEDPVVRMRAADVRKRLAQFYQSLERDTPVLHIELQPGSYRVRFRQVEPEDASATSPQSVSESPGFTTPNEKGFSPLPQASDHVSPGSPTTLGSLPQTVAPQPLSMGAGTFLKSPRLAVLVFILALLAVLSPWAFQSRSTPQERFWAPLTAASQPVLVYLGSNAAYVLSSSFLAAYRTTHGLPNNGPEFFVDLPPDSSVKAKDLVPVKDTFVTVSDATAIVQLTTQLRDWKRPFVLRYGSDLSMGDLRNRPTLMVGAFNNPWTLIITNDLPFRFREGVRIEDRDHPDRGWSVAPDTRSSTTDDYALITRVLSSKAGGPAITVAGISEYGTRAGAEFLTNPDKMRNMLKSAPPGWEDKNIQIVLHVKVLGYQPVSTEVVDTRYW